MGSRGTREDAESWARVAVAPRHGRLWEFTVDTLARIGNWNDRAHSGWVWRMIDRPVAQAIYRLDTGRWRG